MRDLYSSGRKHATSVNAEAKKIGIMAVVMTLAVLSALASVGEACIGERARQAQDSRRIAAGVVVVSLSWVLAAFQQANVSMA